MRESTVEPKDGTRVGERGRERRVWLRRDERHRHLHRVGASTKERAVSTRLLSVLSLFLFVVASAACQGDGPSDDALATAQGRLVAPDDCNEEPVVPAMPPLEPTAGVGTIDGSFNVDDHGAAHYTMRLVTPPGRAGVEPSVSLHYGSDGGDGPLGVGFSLGGLSSIARCGSSIAEDGQFRGVKFDAQDHLCLDGARMFVVSGTHFGDAEYRTKPDSFAKIVASDVASGAPQTFTVYAKNGHILTYGKTADARAGGPNGSVRTWALSEVRDRYGNQMTVSYEKVDAPSPDVGLTWEQLPSEIRYTAHVPSGLPAPRKVRFTYSNRAEWNVGFRWGKRFETKRRLDRITMLSTGDTVVRRYELAYTTEGSTRKTKLQSVTECAANGVCKPPTRFRWSLGEEGFVFTSESVAPPDPPLPAVIGTTNPAVVPMAWRDGGYYQFIGMDVDGDGLDDLVYPDNDRWKIIFARSLHDDRVYEHVVTTSASTGAPGRGAKSLGTPIDYDQDGRVDLLLHDASETWRVLHSKGNDFEIWDTGIPRWTPLWGGHPNQARTGSLLVDLNADGALDLVEYRNDVDDAPPKAKRGWFYRLHNGSAGWGSLVRIERLRGAEPFIGLTPFDYDGDGKTELLVHADDSLSGNHSRWFVWSLDNGVASTIGDDILDDRFPWVHDLQNELMRVVDVNGDGLADIVATDTDSGTIYSPKVFLNTGNGLRKKEYRGPEHPLRLEKEWFYYAVALDYDGDGDEDLLVPHRHTGGSTLAFPPDHWVLMRFDGDRYTAEDLPLPFFRLVPKIPGDSIMWAGAFLQAPRAIDTEGTGMRDVVGLNHAGHVTVAKRKRPSHKKQDRPDLLVEIRDGLNLIDGENPNVPGDGLASVRIEYVFLRDIDAWNDDVSEGTTKPGKLPMGGISRGGADVYTSKLGGCTYPQRCVVGGKFVVASHHLDFGSTNNRQLLDHWGEPTSGITNERHVVHAYADARADRHGRGFLGFREHVIRDLTTGVTEKRVFDNVTRDPVTRDYPYANHIVQRITWGDGAPGHALPWYACDETYWQVKYTYASRSGFTYAERTTAKVFDSSALGRHWNVDPEKLCVRTEGPVRVEWTFSDVDAFGTTVHHERTFDDGSRLTETTAVHHDTDRWLLALVDETVSEDRTHEGTLRRSASYAHNPATGAVIRETVTGDGARTVVVDLHRDELGNVLYSHARDDLGVERASCVAYDAEKTFPHLVRNALGHRTYVNYDPRFGARHSIYDHEGRAMLTRHDGFGRAVWDVSSIGTERRTLLSHEIYGDEKLTLVRVVETGRPEARARLDRLGRSVRAWHRAFDGSEIEVERAYDEAGRLQSVSAPHVAVAPSPGASKLTYDDRGRIIQAVSASGETTSLRYRARLTEVTDPRGHLTSLWEDARGQLFTTQDARGAFTTYHHGAFGALVRIADDPGNETVFASDAFGNTLEVVAPDAGHRTYRYDGFGQLVHATDANGATTDITYDAIGRPKRRDDKDGTTRWRWDPAGNVGALESVVAPSGYVDEYGYDTFGRAVTHTATFTDGHSLSSAIEYDPQGRLATLTYPDGSRARYDYNAFGYVHRVYDPDSAHVYWRRLATNAFGQTTNEHFGNGIVGTHAYAPKSGLPESFIVAKGTTNLLDLRFEWDPNRNLATRTDAITSRYELFTYDELNRLTGAIQPNSSEPHEAYEYDAIGNITFKSNLGSYTYDKKRPHAVVAAGPHAFAYDANGNQIERDTVRLEYSARDLPVSIVDGVARIEFEYSGSSARVRKASDVGLGLTTTWYFDGLYEETANASGGFERRCFIQADGHTVAIRASRYSAGAWTTAIRYMHPDHLGSPALVTDDTGAVVERRSYDPFGRARTPTGFTPVHHPSIGYTSHEDDPEYGLVNMRGRIYDPLTARFLTPDPIVENLGNAQTLNPYSYVRNNPLTRIDPSGFTSMHRADGAKAEQAHAWRCGADLCEVYVDRHTFKDVEAPREINLAKDPSPDATGSSAERPTGRSIADHKLPDIELPSIGGKVITDLDRELEESDNVGRDVAIDRARQNAAVESWHVLAKANILVLGPVLGRFAGRAIDDIAGALKAPIPTSAYGRQVYEDEKRSVEIAVEVGAVVLPFLRAESAVVNLEERAAAELPQLGGSYTRVRATATEAGLGGEVHHMPSWSATRDSGIGITRGSGPSIWMRTIDHAKTPSFGSSAASAAYRSQQQALIKGGQYLDALKMDVDAIRAAHGTAYDGAIQQMGEYVWQMGQ